MVEWVLKDMEAVVAFCKDDIPVFAWRDWAKLQTIQSQYMVTGPRFEPVTSQVQCRSITYSLGMFGQCCKSGEI